MSKKDIYMTIYLYNIFVRSIIQNICFSYGRIFYSRSFYSKKNINDKKMFLFLNFLSIFQSLRLFVYMFVCLFVCLYVCLSVFLSIHFSYLSIFSLLRTVCACCSEQRAKQPYFLQNKFGLLIRNVCYKFFSCPASGLLLLLPL